MGQPFANWLAYFVNFTEMFWRKVTCHLSGSGLLGCSCSSSARLAWLATSSASSAYLQSMITTSLMREGWRRCFDSFLDACFSAGQWRPCSTPCWAPCAWATSSSFSATWLSPLGSFSCRWKHPITVIIFQHQTFGTSSLFVQCTYFSILGILSFWWLFSDNSYNVKNVICKNGMKAWNISNQFSRILIWQCCLPLITRIAFITLITGGLVLSHLPNLPCVIPRNPLIHRFNKQHLKILDTIQFINRDLIPN